MLLMVWYVFMLYWLKLALNCFLYPFLGGLSHSSISPPDFASPPACSAWARTLLWARQPHAPLPLLQIPHSPCTKNATQGQSSSTRFRTCLNVSFHFMCTILSASNTCCMHCLTASRRSEDEPSPSSSGDYREMRTKFLCSNFLIPGLNRFSFGTSDKSNSSSFLFILWY